MGNIQSIDPSHVKIFNDLRTIQNPSVKVRMIQTVLAGPEYVASAKHAGVYSDLLAYLAKHRNSAQPTVQPISQQLVIQSPPKQNNIDRLAKANSDEKAIGYFQACLEVLGLEEEVALNEEILKKNNIDRADFLYTRLKISEDKAKSAKASIVNSFEKLAKYTK